MSSQLKTLIKFIIYFLIDLFVKPSKEIKPKFFLLIRLDAPVILCSSVFAKDFHKIPDAAQEYVVLNYMSGGAHYRFGQPIDDAQWEDNFRMLYKTIAKHERVVFSCHNRKEIAEAKKLMPQQKYFIRQIMSSI
jgi:hypothetical protein